MSSRSLDAALRSRRAPGIDGGANSRLRDVPPCSRRAVSSRRLAPRPATPAPQPPDPRSRERQRHVPRRRGTRRDASRSRGSGSRTTASATDRERAAGIRRLPSAPARRPRHGRTTMARRHSAPPGARGGPDATLTQPAIARPVAEDYPGQRAAVQGRDNRILASRAVVAASQSESMDGDAACRRTRLSVSSLPHGSPVVGRRWRRPTAAGTRQTAGAGRHRSTEPAAGWRTFACGRTGADRRPRDGSGAPPPMECSAWRTSSSRSTATDARSKDEQDQATQALDPPFWTLGDGRRRRQPDHAREGEQAGRLGPGATSPPSR